jgi:hypothetical protein
VKQELKLGDAHNIHCWCTILHRVAWPKLIAMAIQHGLGRDREEILSRYPSKFDLCTEFAKRFLLPLRSEDILIGSDIKQFLRTSGSEEAIKARENLDFKHLGDAYSNCKTSFALRPDEEQTLREEQKEAVTDNKFPLSSWWNLLQRGSQADEATRKALAQRTYDWYGFIVPPEGV